MIDPRTALMTVPGAATLVESITAINHRAHQLASVVDRLGPALDDLSVLLKHTQRIAESGPEGINRHAAGIDRHAEGINRSAELIATHSGKIATSLPTVERLAHVLDPLEGTVDRLGRFVDHLPQRRRGRPDDARALPGAGADRPVP